MTTPGLHQQPSKRVYWLSVFNSNGLPISALSIGVPQNTYAFAHVGPLLTMQSSAEVSNFNMRKITTKDSHYMFYKIKDVLILLVTSDTHVSETLLQVLVRKLYEIMACIVSEPVLNDLQRVDALKKRLKVL